MPENQPKRRWLKPTIALIIVAAFTTWFIVWANQRINTLPPTEREAYTQIGPINTPPVDKKTTAHLINVCDTLYQQWTFSTYTTATRLRTLIDHLEKARKGSWNPNQRPDLQIMAEYFKSTPVDKALNSLSQFRDKRCQLKHRLDFLCTDPTNAIAETDINTIAQTLVSRARYRSAQLNDISGSWEDLKTSLWLANVTDIEYLHTFNQSLDLEATACWELIHLTGETRFPLQLAIDINQTINESPDLLAKLLTALKGEEILARTILATCYADTPDNNGWLILNTGRYGARNCIDPVVDLWFSQLYKTGERSPLWNLTTICHRKRKAADEKLQSIFRSFRDAISPDYRKSAEKLMRLEFFSPFDEMDGPHKPVCKPYTRIFTHDKTWEQIALRRATQVTLALNVYYHRHGCYPKTLPSEIPGWPDKLPLDPYSGEPFGYVCQNRDKYRLGSYGENSLNDGGISKEEARIKDALTYKWDIIYTADR